MNLGADLDVCCAEPESEDEPRFRKSEVTFASGFTTIFVYHEHLGKMSCRFGIRTLIPRQSQSRTYEISPFQNVAFDACTLKQLCAFPVLVSVGVQDFPAPLCQFPETNSSTEMSVINAGQSLLNPGTHYKNM
jgi:hypothetical protein